MLTNIANEFKFKTSYGEFVAKKINSYKYLISEYKPRNGILNSTAWASSKILKNINDGFWTIIDQPVMVIGENGEIVNG